MENEKNVYEKPSSLDKKRKSGKSSVEDDEVTFKKCPPTYKSNFGKFSAGDQESCSNKKTCPLLHSAQEVDNSSDSDKKHYKYKQTQETEGKEEGEKKSERVIEETYHKKIPDLGKENVLTGAKEGTTPQGSRKTSEEKKESLEEVKSQSHTCEKEEENDKVRDDSLPPPDFEENYLIAQSDILRQASLEYDRRMKEHKEKMKQMKKTKNYDKSDNVEFPDFETWMEERGKEGSLKRSSDKESDLKNDEEVEQGTKVGKENFVIETSKETHEVVVVAQIEPIPKDEETAKEERGSSRSEKEAEIFAKIREMITQEYLVQSQESLKEIDIVSVKNLVVKKTESLIKQNSLKEMRRELEKKWLENKKKGKTEVRRKSEEKSFCSEKIKQGIAQRRSFSFDEEILI